MDRRLENLFYRTGLVFFVIWIIAALLLQSGYTLKIHLPESRCIFQVVLGMYCPGCGGTRAVLALMRGQILRSLWYHPLVLYGAIAYLCFMISHTITLFCPGYKGIRFRAWYLYGALAVLGINFIVKNILKLVFGICMI